VGTLLLDVGCGDDLGGDVEPFTEVVEALGSEGVVVVLPGELGFEEAAGGEGLAGFDHEEVLGIDLAMFGEVEVFLGHEDTLTKEVLVDLLAVRLWDEHSREFLLLFGESRRMPCKVCRSMVESGRGRESWTFTPNFAR